MPYRDNILPVKLSANTVSRFFTIAGSKLDCLSCGVIISTLPTLVFNVFLPLPFRLFFFALSSSSRCPSISASKAVSKNCFKSGANTPSLPVNDCPAFMLSSALLKILLLSLFCPYFSFTNLMLFGQSLIYSLSLFYTQTGLHFSFYFA
jgi:hypothetical protein